MTATTGAGNHTTAARCDEFVLELGRLEPPPPELAGSNLPCYEVRLTGNPVGGDYWPRRVLLPLEPAQVEAFYQWLRYQRVQSAIDAAAADALTEAVKLGRALFDFVLGDTLAEAYGRALDHAARSGRRLRLRLKLDAAELENLPWEYLCHPRQKNDFLTLDHMRPLVRHLRLEPSARRPAVPPKLRILGLIGADLPNKDRRACWSDETSKIRQLMLDAGQDAEVLIPNPLSLEDLQAWLRENGQFHVVHYIGHGRFDTKTQEGQLLLAASKGGRYWVSADRLRVLLQGQQDLRLVVLCACHSALSSCGDLFSSVAASLVLNNVPAIVAMQFDVLDRTALRFTHHLYHTLAQGYTVEDALVEGRKAIYLHGTKAEFGVPVLYSRQQEALRLCAHHPAPPLSQDAIQADSGQDAALVAEARALLARMGERLLLQDVNGTADREQAREMKGQLEEAERILEQRLAASPEPSPEPTPASPIDASPPGLPGQLPLPPSALETAATRMYIEPADFTFRLLGAAQLLSMGERLYAEARMEMAAHYFAQAVRKDAANGRAHYWLGAAQVGLGRMSDAVRSLTKAIELDGTHVDAHVQLAVAYAGLGRRDDELVILSRAIELSPHYYEARAARGWLFYGQRHFDAAIEDVSYALLEHPDDADLVLLRARCYDESDPPRQREAFDDYKAYLDNTEGQALQERMQAHQRLSALFQHLYGADDEHGVVP